MQPNDQNSEPPQQSQYPEYPQPSPSDEPSMNGSSMARVIQPLSSEDSIRSAAQTSEAQAEVQSETPAYDNYSSSCEEPETLGGYGISTFAAEPIKRPESPVVESSITPPLQDAPVKKGNKKLPVALAAVVLFAGIVGVCLFLFSGKVWAADLIRETDGSATYLRPKQWQPMTPLTVQGISSYSNRKVDEGGLTSLVMFRETPSIPQFANTSDDMIDLLRKELMNRAASDQMGLGVSGPMACDMQSDPKVEEDTKKNATTTGLISSSHTCESDGKKVTTKIRVVIGKDGTARMIAVMARDESWAINEKVFQSMLDSVEQRSS